MAILTNVTVQNYVSGINNYLAGGQSAGNGILITTQADLDLFISSLHTAKPDLTVLRLNPYELELWPELKDKAGSVAVLIIDYAEHIEATSSALVYGILLNRKRSKSIICVYNPANNWNTLKGQQNCYKLIA